MLGVESITSEVALYPLTPVESDNSILSPAPTTSYQQPQHSPNHPHHKTPDKQGVESRKVIKQKDTINKRCDHMLYEQLECLQDTQDTLKLVLDKIETSTREKKDTKCLLEQAAHLYEQAEHGAMLVDVIGKMQNELLHSRLDLEKLPATADKERMEHVESRAQWLETRIEKILLFHRQHVLEGKRVKAHLTSSNSSLADDKDRKKSAPEKEIPEKILPALTASSTPTQRSLKSYKSNRSKGTNSTKITITKSQDKPTIESLWGKKSGVDQPLWHTLPLVPRSPFIISSPPYDRDVPWLDRRGSSYDLLCFQREEFNHLMDKVAKIYDHIQTISDASYETDPLLQSPTNFSSRLSKPAPNLLRTEEEEWENDLPTSITWSRLTRNEANIYPRKTSVWHKGKDMAPVRRIVNQQKTTTDSRQSTPRRAISSQSRTRINRAKTRLLASVSLTRLSKNAQEQRESSTAHVGLMKAKKDRFEFLMNECLRSEVGDVRREAVRDLGELYHTQPSFTVINALKSTVYTDHDIFVLIEASKSLLKIGVWDIAALEIIIQSIKYGSAGLRCSLLEVLKNSKNPHLFNKQSIQFRVMKSLLLTLCDEEDVRLASLSALTCACLGINVDKVKDKLLLYLDTGDEDLKSQALRALIVNMKYHSVRVIDHCLHQTKAAIKWENRSAAVQLIVNLTGAIDDYDKMPEVFERLQVLLYDDCSKEVRMAVSQVINDLGLHARVLQQVVKKLDDLSEDIRAQGVMSLSIIGIKGKSLLNQILDILELDSSVYVRIQVMRALRELQITDRRALRLIRERAKGPGLMCKEAQISLQVLTGEE